jgi:hypothetical protein
MEVWTVTWNEERFHDFLFAFFFFFRISQDWRLEWIGYLSFVTALYLSFRPCPKKHVAQQGEGAHYSLLSLCTAEQHYQARNKRETC